MKDKLPVKFFEHNSEPNLKLVEELSKLKPGDKTNYLISAGTKRKTLAIIDSARTIEKFRNEDAKFTFGKLIRDGQNVFVGIRVLRTK